MKEQEEGENCIMRSFMMYSSPNIMGHVECMRQIRTGMYKPLVLY
jgi:hypothetical protein